MLSYKDMTFCVAYKCKNLDCFRNQATINNKELAESGLGLALGDFYRTCEYYTPYKEDDYDRKGNVFVWCMKDKYLLKNEYKYLLTIHP